MMPRGRLFVGRLFFGNLGRLFFVHDTARRRLFFGPALEMHEMAWGRLGDVWMTPGGRLEAVSGDGTTAAVSHLIASDFELEGQFCLFFLWSLSLKRRRISEIL